LYSCICEYVSVCTCVCVDKCIYWFVDCFISCCSGKAEDTVKTQCVNPSCAIELRAYRNRMVVESGETRVGLSLSLSLSLCKWLSCTFAQFLDWLYTHASALTRNM
jgi:hypothetical protein